LFPKETYVVTLFINSFEEIIYMTVRRNSSREVVYNSSELYSNILKRRNKDFIEQYVTGELKYPTQVQIQSLFLKRHMWVMGDRFWKLSATNYGDPELWWTIAWFNKRPTEAHVRYGDIVYIPHPLDKLYSYYGI